MQDLSTSNSRRVARQVRAPRVTSLELIPLVLVPCSRQHLQRIQRSGTETLVLTMTFNVQGHGTL